MTSLYRSIWPLIAAFMLAIAFVGWLLIEPVLAESTGQEMPVYRSVDQKTSAHQPNLKKMARRNHSTSRDCLPKSLKRHLAYVEKRYGGIRIVSTFRKGAVIAGSGSPSKHAKCLAVDMHPAPGTYRLVLNYLLENHDGGLITYSCGMSHIHIEQGEKFRAHKCVDKRGRPWK